MYQTYNANAATEPSEATREIQNIVAHQILHQPRSLQTRIGPSEIGNPCDHCLAARLAGWEKQEDGIPLATTIGTGYHALMEDFFKKWEAEQAETNPGWRHRYLMEQRVTVGQIGGQEITGSTDLLDLAAGLTVDYKVVGKTSFDKYRINGPSPTYQIQAHLYAKGWNDAGVKVDTVSIWFIPKMAIDLRSSHWWLEPYQPLIAENALQRANRIWNHLLIARDVTEYIKNLPRQPGCWDCRKYPDRPIPIDPLFDLNNPHQ